MEKKIKSASKLSRSNSELLKTKIDYAFGRRNSSLSKKQLRSESTKSVKTDQRNQFKGKNTANHVHPLLRSRSSSTKSLKNTDRNICSRETQENRIGFDVDQLLLLKNSLHQANPGKLISNGASTLKQKTPQRTSQKLDDKRSDRKHTYLVDSNLNNLETANRHKKRNIISREIFEAKKDVAFDIKKVNILLWFDQMERNLFLTERKCRVVKANQESKPYQQSAQATMTTQLRVQNTTKSPKVSSGIDFKPGVDVDVEIDHKAHRNSEFVIRVNSQNDFQKNTMQIVSVMICSKVKVGKVELQQKSFSVSIKSCQEFRGSSNKRKNQKAFLVDLQSTLESNASNLILLSYSSSSQDNENKIKQKIYIYILNEIASLLNDGVENLQTACKIIKRNLKNSNFVTSDCQFRKRTQQSQFILILEPQMACREPQSQTKNHRKKLQTIISQKLKIKTEQDSVCLEANSSLNQKIQISSQKKAAVQNKNQQFN